MLNTNWLIKREEALNGKDALINLIRLLFNYPFNGYLNMALEFLEFSDKLKNNELITDKTELIDYLKLLSLLHVTNSFENEQENSSNNDKRIEVFFSICNYFNSRYRDEIELKKRNEEINSYKYKLYGQAKLTSEIDECEYESMFPSFLNEFREFSGPSMDSNETTKNDLAENTQQEHIDHKILNQVFQLICFKNFYSKINLS